jgi:hypothetical protein
VIFLWKSGSKLMAENGSILLAIDRGVKMRNKKFKPTIFIACSFAFVAGVFPSLCLNGNKLFNTKQ